MTSREWFGLALRILGVWILIQAVEQFPLLIFYLTNTTAWGAQAFITQLIWLSCRTALALTLIIFAPAIASRFYPVAESEETTTSEINETRALRVGIKLLAVYALLLAVQSAAGAAHALLFLGIPPSYGSFEDGYSSSFLTCGLNLAFACILLMWNEQVVQFIAKCRYVAERDAYEAPPLDE